jgi:hypothetical protein
MLNTVFVGSVDEAREQLAALPADRRVRVILLDEAEVPPMPPGSDPVKTTAAFAELLRAMRPLMRDVPDADYSRESFYEN